MELPGHIVETLRQVGGGGTTVTTRHFLPTVKLEFPPTRCDSP